MSLLLFFAPGSGSDVAVVAGAAGPINRLTLLGVSLLGYLFLG